MVELAIVIIGAFIFAAAIVYTIFYRCEAAPSGLKISFRKFKSLYAIAPDKWNLYRMSVSYSVYTENGHFDNFVMLHFSILETIPYELFRRRLEHEQEQQNANRTLEEAINCWQKDIDVYREKYCGGAK